VFCVSDFVTHANTTFVLDDDPKGFRSVIRFLSRRLPSIGFNVRAKQNYQGLARLLTQEAGARTKVLVVGGSIMGEGMEALGGLDQVDLVETDVSFGPRTMLILDGHDLPFEDDSFDGVIAQAVLEHVVDPCRCVEEIYRVLKPGGVVYAETPFMQQVHMGRYDFTRFTHLGHRRLFRHFEEIDSGPSCGPGMALAWAYQYFLLSFTTSRVLRSLIRAFTQLTSFYLKYFDFSLVGKSGAFDAASAYYFLGRKAQTALSDRELIAQYRGAF